MLKNAKLNAVTIILLMCVSGCTNIHVIDSFCLTAKPITVTKKELNQCLSEETIRQIDNYNQEIEYRCR